ncbi:MAG: hypothetical protein V3U65_08620 [Granulosicoccaceae bacterium]
MKFSPATRNGLNRISCLLVVGTLSLLSACSSSDDSATPADTNIAAGHYAFVATAGGGAGQIERYSLADNTQNGTYPATMTDLSIATDGTHVYEIGRFNLDTLTKYDVSDTSAPVYQFSVNGDETQANPYDVIFVNDTKAYVIRYGSTQVWIIDPSVDALDEANFRTGELDLSVYDTGGAPKASGAVLVGGKLFILMQRLDAGFAPSSVGYVAVFDTTTDEQINTGKGTDGLPGIALSTLNPSNIQYLEARDEIYVTGRGNIFGNPAVTGDPYQGGIETIDPTSYDIAMLLDDGTEAENNDFFSSALIVSPSLGYLITNSGFDATTFASIDTLRSFNPTTGILAAEPVAGLVDTSIANLHVAPDGLLWVGVPGDAPGFNLIDTSTNMIVGEFLATTLAPLDVVFVDVPEITAEQ